MDTVIHIRLNCVPKLQKDKRHLVGRWEMLSPEQALNAIGELVFQSPNQALWLSSFFSSRQGKEEPMKDYFQKCTAEVLECQFRCPTCDTDELDYMVFRKVMVGLSDPALKKEVFQGYTSFNSVDQLR